MQAVQIQVPDNRFGLQVHQTIQRPLDDVLAINAALQIKAAEYWLKLGQADEALRELENLPHNTWNHASAIKARIRAMGALREQSDLAIRE